MEIKVKGDQKIEIPRQVQEIGEIGERMKTSREQIDEFQSDVKFNQFAVDEYRKALGEVLKTNPSAKEAGEILQGQLKMLKKLSPEEKKEFKELVDSLPVEQQGQLKTLSEILGDLAKIVNAQKEKEQREKTELAETRETLEKRYGDKQSQASVRQAPLREEEVKAKQGTEQTQGFFQRLKSFIWK